MGQEIGRAIGMMSGTSGDGIDAALVQFCERGGAIPEMTLVASHYVPYSKNQRDKVFRLFQPDVSARFVAEMDVAMGHWFGEAARQLMRTAGVEPRQVSVIGSHGQTVYHAPDSGVSLQIGDGASIAQMTGCAVVTDFRRQDLALGGQGAPLVPYFDYAYLRHDHVHRVVLNIGGIANVTILPKHAQLNDVMAFDTGAGNMVIDALVDEITGGRETFDLDGRLARQGKPAQSLVSSWLENDVYIQAPPPKSTGRERYGGHFLMTLKESMTDLTVADQVATVTSFVAQSISVNIRKHVREPFELIVGGGGRKNATLMDWLQASCQPILTIDSAELGIPSDMKEAMAFALLAWQFTHGRSTNVPSATGASGQTRLGKLTPEMGATLVD